VTQEPFLFASTLADNIAAGRPSASRAEIEEAARAAEIHDEIAEFPEGYDTVVGIGGRGLSGGQAQRVNIARAILKNAPILLLDEATSSLDSLAEAKVQRAIDRLMEGRTTFIVAHRLSTLRHASRILVLDRGAMVGFAPHGELLDTCPLYRRLWETQQFVAPARRAPASLAAASRACDVPPVLAEDLPS
jgi:ABC-type multidrug transport system fused ATPase/permease subunit